MKAARLTILFIAMIAGLSRAADKAADFEYGQRPPYAVFDPDDFLGSATVREISAPLAKIRSEEGVDVIVVLLKDIKDAPPQFVAGRFADAWCDTAIHAVVLYVPGRTDGPWIVPGGDLLNVLNPDIISAKVAAATRNVSREPNDAAKVRAAATETADMLRYWTGGAINRSKRFDFERARIFAEMEASGQKRKIILLVVIASLVPLVAALGWIYFRLRGRKSRRFPDIQPPQRLGAPHAGGNHLSIDLGPPASRNP